MTQKDALLTLINRKQPRAYNDKTCVYDHDINGGCAVGCLLPKELASKLGGEAVDGIFNELPNEIQKLGCGFLQEIQSVHDMQHYWNNCETGEVCKNGLVWNQKGVDRINEIIGKYNLEIPLLKFGGVE